MSAENAERGSEVRFWGVGEIADTCCQLGKCGGMWAVVFKGRKSKPVDSTFLESLPYASSVPMSTPYLPPFLMLIPFLYLQCLARQISIFSHQYLNLAACSST